MDNKNKTEQELGDDELEKVNGGVNPFVSGFLLNCEECGSMFRTQEELSQHIFERHSSPNTCRICGASFSSVSALIEHQKTH